MTVKDRINAFVCLGNFLKQFSEKEIKHGDHSLNNTFYNDLNELITIIHLHNPWFTEDNVRFAIKSITKSLDQEILENWLSTYLEALNEKKNSHNIAVIMAGNIPLVGFHDMLCVLISGNKFLGKLSSEDKLLLPFIAKILVSIEPAFNDFIEFTEGQIKNMEAVIATGSNNTARYFDYYFGKYPHIIRKNRNSIAVLAGTESDDELRLLGRDIFQYFGLGCRNISKLFVPRGYTFETFYQAIFDYQHVVNHNKYANNYDYNKTVYLMSVNPTLLDNNFLLLKEDSTYSSPIGVLFYEFYDTIDEINKRITKDEEQIQCVVSSNSAIQKSIPFGEAQCPRLNDYADGVDTVKFLIGLK